MNGATIAAMPCVDATATLRVTLDIGPQRRVFAPLSYRAISAVRSFNSIGRLATEPGGH